MGRNDAGVNSALDDNIFSEPHDEQEQARFVRLHSQASLFGPFISTCTKFSTTHQRNNQHYQVMDHGVYPSYVCVSFARPCEKIFPRIRMSRKMAKWVRKTDAVQHNVSMSNPNDL